MNRKDAVQVINELIQQKKASDLKNAIDDYTKEVRLAKASAAPAPAPAIPKPKMQAAKPPAMPKQPQMVAKIDPSTKLPGTLLDKVSDGGNTMGTSTMTMTPSPTLKASPDMAPPMAANESVKASLAQKMSKCMMAKSAEKGVHQRSIIPNRSTPKMEDKNSSSMGDDVRSSKIAWNSKAPGNAKASAQHVLSELKAMPKANLPKSEMAKDDQAHAPNSPQDKAHDIVEEGQSVQSAVSDLGSKPEIKKMFEHLRSKRSNPNWERSAANQAAGMDKSEEAKEISKDAEKAIEVAADQPMKEQTQRPGQANEPKADKKI